MATCFKCGNEFPREIRISRTEECPRCNQPVRCCKNCLFYLPGAHWDCRETVPEQVVDKERANFCEFFRLNTRSPGPEKPPEKPSRRAFDDLFS